MKIFHYFNTGGLASVIAKYQARIGHDVQVFCRKKYDIFHFGKFYSETISYSHWDWIPIKKLSSWLTVYEGLTLMSDFDLICVHGHDKSLPYIKRLYPDKPVWLFYHGSGIRGLWSKKEVYWSLADRVFVFSDDLLDGAECDVQLLPRPVDLEHFKRTRFDAIREKAVGLFFIKRNRSQFYGEYIQPLVNNIMCDFGLVGIHVVNNDIWVHPYADMPDLFNMFEYVIDIPQAVYEDVHRVDGVFSLIGLQALASGCKVLTHWYGDMFCGFPYESDAVSVVATLESLIEKL